MQSRLVSVGSSSSLSVIRKQFLPWMRAASTGTRIGTADPAIHSHDPTDEELEQAERAATAEKEPLKTRTIEDNQPTAPHPTTPYASSPKLESTVVGSKVDPSFQQKRPCHRSAEPIEDAICVGVDGTPFSGPEKLPEDDYREYFKDHGPSPISEIEVADTRKPINQATDGSVYEDEINYDVVGWKEEQIDSAEEALRRAEKIFRQRAEEGVPDWPQSRVLRVLRRECFEEEQ
ncbi:uncharacterized protein [Aristolochia californica]|uniref:uncharacterized protein n=1 Tax=Aristolochia californica TaxID=171875 RepID=UPI0035DE0C14